MGRVQTSVAIELAFFSAFVTALNRSHLPHFVRSFDEWLRSGLRGEDPRLLREALHDAAVHQVNAVNRRIRFVVVPTAAMLEDPSGRLRLAGLCTSVYECYLRTHARQYGNQAPPTRRPYDLFATSFEGLDLSNDIFLS
jgi:hypothetical protein